VPTSRPRYFSPLYRNLRAIEPTDYHRLIREYEQQEQAIGRLDTREHFELIVLYVDALFETGAYRKHLLMVDQVLYLSFEENLQQVDGEDIFERMLFRKAASSYRLYDLDTAEHVLREMLRINPENDAARQFLEKTLYKKQVSAHQLMRATAVLSFLTAALAIFIELLIVRNFYRMYLATFVWARSFLFIFGLLALLVGELYTRRRAFLEARRFRDEQRRRKQKHNNQT
jgi:uncharacterized integral membrane protein